LPKKTSFLTLTPAVNVIKSFFLFPYEEATLARVLAPGRGLSSLDLLFEQGGIYSSGAPRLGWKRIARKKHSSLFSLFIIAKEDKFCKIDTGSQCYKTFILLCL
jgi:hypothetical protein